MFTELIYFRLKKKKQIIYATLFMVYCCGDLNVSVFDSSPH